MVQLIDFQLSFPCSHVFKCCSKQLSKVKLNLTLRENQNNDINTFLFNDFKSLNLKGIKEFALHFEIMKTLSQSCFSDHYSHI